MISACPSYRSRCARDVSSLSRTLSRPKCSFFCQRRALYGRMPVWTRTFRERERDLGAIGLHEFQWKFVWTNGPFAIFSVELRMDQWRRKFVKSFSWDWHWSMDGSSQFLVFGLTWCAPCWSAFFTSHSSGPHCCFQQSSACDGLGRIVSPSSQGVGGRAKHLECSKGVV